MAIAKGQQTGEAITRQLYMGMASVKVLAVNPSKKELEKIYGREFDKEPEYITEVDVDGKKVPSARITFIVQATPERNNGIDAIFQHTFFLQRRYRQGSQSGKYQIIDAYGRTAWATKDEVKAKAIPQYNNGPANIDADYRPAIVGEDMLTLFIKNLLNIPSVQNYVNGMWVENTKVNKEDCLVRLDEIEKYFTGDFKELREVISYQPDNHVKIAVGIRHTDDGKTYQTTYDGLCFKANMTDYSKLDKEIMDRKNNGGLANVEYDITDLREYVVNPTPSADLMGDGEAVVMEDDPWGDNN